MNELPIIAQAHLVVGTTSVIAGFASMLFRKGGNLHRLIGKIFFYSMLLLCFSGFYLSITRSLQLTFLLAFFSLYLLLTGWYAMARSNTNTSIWDKLGFYAIAIVGVGAFFIASAGMFFNLKHPETEPPYAAYYLFVIFAVVLAYLDYNVIKKPTLIGTQRLIRHLWRMNFSLLIATTIFFTGNSHILPEALRTDLLLGLPIYTVIAFMVFWVIYVKKIKKPIISSMK